MSEQTPAEAESGHAPTWEEFHRRALALNIMVIERSQDTPAFFQPGKHGRRLYLNHDLPAAERLAAGWKMLESLAGKI